MKTIWKFPLDIQDTQEIPIPKGATILSVIEQNDIPVMYALVDPGAPQMPISVEMRGTGHPVEENLMENYIFLDTVNTHGGASVWHIFIERDYLLRNLV